jgi:hypothetical protein
VGAKLPETLKGELYKLFLGEGFGVELDAIKDDAKNELELFPNGLDVAVVFSNFASFATV